jgi:hypothetical protein
MHVQAFAAAGLLFLAGCTAATPAPSPTPAPAPATAPTQTGAPASVNGAITTVSGRTLTISTNTGSRDVQLAEDVRLEEEGKGTLADLLPGLSVGITGRPDGQNVTAVSIRIFPAALGTPRPGQFPMNGAQAGNVMTNSVIESFDGSNLSVNAAGQRFLIAVPPGTEVLKPVPATLGELVPGTRVQVTSAPTPDGSVRATSVNLVGLPPQ